jgi:hypothetical protein
LKDFSSKNILKNIFDEYFHLISAIVFQGWHLKVKTFIMQDRVYFTKENFQSLHQKCEFVNKGLTGLFVEQDYHHPNHRK